MPEEVDKSLLDRLAALRGSSPASQRQAPVRVPVDVIERKKTPSREDALASRLKSLRSRSETPSSPPPPSSHSSSPQETKHNRPSQPATTTTTITTEKPAKDASITADEDVDAAFLTDDRTLEELLGDVGPESEFNTHQEPDDDKVKALLEELSQSIPQDDSATKNKSQETKENDSDDDSDGEKMNKEVDDVIARFRDEIELEAADDEPPSPEQEDQAQEEDEHTSTHHQQQQQPPNLDLPSVPQDPTAAAASSSSPPASTSLDDITARLSALRASSASPSPLADLPSVPTSRPAKEPKRLTSRTNYTDDDVDSWCTVCLEDATLKCLGCDDDPYCVRCWREMHVGPAASFDDRDHKAVHFTKDRKKKEKRVALGA